MNSGSMLIPNDFGSKTMLLIRDGKALADPPTNALIFATRELRISQAANSPKEAQVAFLTEWIDKFNNPIEVKEEIKKSSTTLVPDKVVTKIPQEKIDANALRAKQIADEMRQKRG